MAANPTDPTVLDLLQPGELGDTQVPITPSARQIAAMYMFVSFGCDVGLHVLAHEVARAEDVHHEWNISFRAAQLRTALAISRVLSSDMELSIAAQLAETEGEWAAFLAGEDD